MLGQIRVSQKIGSNFFFSLANNLTVHEASQEEFQDNIYRNADRLY